MCALNVIPLCRLNMAYNIDITHTRGDTKRIILFLTNPETGNILDISSWDTFRIAIDTRKSAPVGSNANIATLTGSLLTDGTDGAIAFVGAGAIATEGSYYHNAQAVDENNELYTFAKGRFILSGKANPA